MAPDTPPRRTFADLADTLFGPREPGPLQRLADRLYDRCDAEPRPLPEYPPVESIPGLAPKPPTERGWWDDPAWSEYRSAFWDENGTADPIREVDRTFENEVRPR